MPNNVDRDCWSYWYPGKNGKIEPELETFEKLLEEKVNERSGREAKFIHILDVGCGTGRHTIHLAGRTGFRVYGFDFSPLAIESAKYELHRKGLSALLTVRSMTAPFEYPDSFFDGVISTRVIGHAYSEQVKGIVREMNRVLKTGGYLFLQVPAHKNEMRLIEERGGKDRVRFVDPKTHVPFDGPEKGIPHYHFTKEELLNDFFSNYNVLHIHEGTEHYGGICFIAEKEFEI
jgi:SAM-dependent methyltransferase